MSLLRTVLPLFRALNDSLIEEDAKGILIISLAKDVPASITKTLSGIDNREVKIILNEVGILNSFEKDGGMPDSAL